MKVLCILVSVVVAVNAGYHEQVGIPLAASIKEYEDRVFAERHEINGRIVGGDVAFVLEHPYMVGMLLRLISKSLSMCGATLVTATRLVTAAHCFSQLKSIKVVLGSVFIYHGGTRIITKDFKAHPSFNESVSLDYDIGVVKIPPIHKLYGESIHPVNLPKTEDEAEIVGEWAVAAGWGLTKDGNRDKQRSEFLVLNDVRLQIIPETVCIMEYNSYKIRGNGVCTEGRGGVGPCDGDSGGPLVVDRRGTKVLVGVISHGYIPCEGSRPAVHTRVHPYTNFILEA